MLCKTFLDKKKSYFEASLKVQGMIKISLIEYFNPTKVNNPNQTRLDRPHGSDKWAMPINGCDVNEQRV